MHCEQNLRRGFRKDDVGFEDYDGKAMPLQPTFF